MQDDGATPLYIACYGGHGAVVTALLASGAAVNQARTVGVERRHIFAFVVYITLLRFIWHMGDVWCLEWAGCNRYRVVLVCVGGIRPGWGRCGNEW